MKSLTEIWKPIKWRCHPAFDAGFFEKTNYQGIAGQARNDKKQKKIAGQIRNDKKQKKTAGQARNDKKQKKIAGQIRNDK